MELGFYILLLAFGSGILGGLWANLLILIIAYVSGEKLGNWFTSQTYVLVGFAGVLAVLAITPEAGLAAIPLGAFGGLLGSLIWFRFVQTPLKPN